MNYENGIIGDLFLSVYVVALDLYPKHGTSIDELIASYDLVSKNHENKFVRAKAARESINLVLSKIKSIHL